MKPIITNEDEAMQAIADGAEVITIDGKEVMDELAKEVRKGKPKARAFIMRIVIEVGQKRPDGNLDIVSSENAMAFDDSVRPSKLIEKIKPQLIDTVNKARAHVPLAVLAKKESKDV